MMGALAQFQLDALKERTLAGIVAARGQGKRTGRPPTISDEEWAAIKDLLATGGRISAIATVRGVTRQAIYYRLAQEITDAVPPVCGGAPPRRRSRRGHSTPRPVRTGPCI
jgi:DNA invertase Pin-like site-specific DNA recombinase